ncbi:MAG: hypothetical protein Q9213_001244 [Squamulea squamosa]
MRDTIKTNVKGVLKVTGSVVLITVISPIICIYGIWLVSTGQSLKSCGTTRMQHARRKAEKRILRQEAPTPLSLRKRALTLPLPVESPAFLSKKVIRSTKDQLQSAFFGRLPLEIREMIYRYALCNFVHIHIYRRQDKRLGHYKCRSVHRPESHVLNPEYQAGQGCGYPSVTSTGAWIPGRWQDGDITELLPLLKTCRRLYFTPPGIYTPKCFLPERHQDCRTFLENYPATSPRPHQVHRDNDISIRSVVESETQYTDANPRKRSKYCRYDRP